MHMLKQHAPILIYAVRDDSHSRSLISSKV